MSHSTTGKLRILKTWISGDLCLIFQCQASGNGEEYPKKTHLTLDLRQQSFGARFTAEKPSDASSNHAFIQILRKQLANFAIKEILVDEASGNLYIPLLSGPETSHPWRIILFRSRPPLASLVDPEGIVFVSYGQKGTFTKKHSLNSPIPEQLEKNLLPALLSEIALSKQTDTDRELQTLDVEDSPLEADRELVPEAQRELVARLKRKQKTIRKTLEKLKKDLPSASEVEAEERRAFLLQSYAHLVKLEAIELRLEPALSGLDEELVINLDPEKTTGAQIEAAFQSFRRVRRGRDMGRQQIERADSEMQSLAEDLEFLKQARSPSDWDSLSRKYRLPAITLARKSAQDDDGGAKAFKTYQASTGHTILVGKDAQHNDTLTKSARSNDYWLHAVNVTGSHVIIPAAPDIRQTLPTQLMREAAILALHFSRFREDLAGECYVTRKAQLKKQKGMPPGLWRINQSESFFFRYTEAELKILLATVKI